MSSVHLMGYSVSSMPLQTCSAEILEWVRHGTHCKSISCLNPHSYAVAKYEPRFASALRTSDWLLPDGTGVALACGAITGRRLPRITGSDLFYRLSEDMNRVGDIKVFFIGSTPQVLARICEQYALQFPNVKVVGCHAPPFESEMSDRAFADCVRAVSLASPDVLYVGMTAPKQEIFIARARGALPVKAALGIGAVFDYYSGRRTRPSAWVRSLGLEWLARLAAEPSRMWRRTLVSAPVFVRDLLLQRHEQR